MKGQAATYYLAMNGGEELSFRTYPKLISPARLEDFNRSLIENRARERMKRALKVLQAHEALSELSDVKRRLSETQKSLTNETIRATMGWNQVTDLTAQITRLRSSWIVRVVHLYQSIFKQEQYK